MGPTDPLDKLAGLGFRVYGFGFGSMLFNGLFSNCTARFSAPRMGPPCWVWIFKVRGFGDTALKETRNSESDLSIVQPESLNPATVFRFPNGSGICILPEMPPANLKRYSPET